VEREASAKGVVTNLGGEDEIKRDGLMLLLAQLNSFRETKLDQEMLLQSESKEAEAYLDSLRWDIDR
jgi:hypothetical protein